MLFVIAICSQDVGGSFVTSFKASVIVPDPDAVDFVGLTLAGLTSSY